MGGDVKGGGLFVYDWNPLINQSLTYSEGLRVPRTNATLELEGLSGTATFGKKKGYDRVSFPHFDFLRFSNLVFNIIGIDHTYQVERNTVH